MEPTKISKELLKRLPVYLHYLKSLPEAHTDISATAMAKALGLGDVMVRKDLAKISKGGRRKLGYVRAYLVADIERFLDVNSCTNAVVVGAGKLGQALLDYGGFEPTGLTILAGFDIDPQSNHTDGGKPILHVDALREYCCENVIRIGVIAVPGEHAQTVCDQLVSCGVRAIWNFAPVHLTVPDDVIVHSENLAVSLTSLRLRMRMKDEKQ